MRNPRSISARSVMFSLPACIFANLANSSEISMVVFNMGTHIPDYGSKVYRPRTNAAG